MVALIVAVVAGISLPFVIEWRAAEESDTASEWLAHTAEVRATMYRALLSVRTSENATLNAYAGVENPAMTRQLVQNERGKLDGFLDRTRQLTVDNAEQQNRIGALQSIVEGRLRLMDDALEHLAENRRDAAQQDLKQASLLFTYDSAAQEIIDAETELMGVRQRHARASHERAQHISIGATIAQLVLLGLLILVSEQQVRRRMQAEQSTRRAVLRAQRVVQTVREPIAVLDHNLRLILTNASFAELYAGGEAAAKAAEDGADALNPLDSVPLDAVGGDAWTDPALLQRLRDVAARDRELWDYELEQRMVDGQQRIVVVNACTMSLPEQSTDAILMTVSDVTARKRTEQHITELNRDLENRIEEVSEINRELEAFSYSVSHDLRAPLRHISGFSSKLAARIDPGDEKSLHYLHIMGDAARRMSMLIEGLLTYSRLGRHAMRFQPVDMNALVTEVRRTLEDGLQGRSVEWVIEALPSVMGDENMLRQVWQNLIDNAIKYTAGTENARIEVCGERSGNGEMVYSVIDNGVGFDMEYADNLFGVFQRMHKASEYPGSGIGLANVRRIITRHGGRIWADAAPGKGATFHFSLPAAASIATANGNQA